MRRRDALRLIGVGLAGVPAAIMSVPALSQVTRPWLIAAMINATKAQSDIDSLGPFREALEALGYREGRDFTLVERYSDGDIGRVPSLAAELVSLAPDLILTAGAEAPALHEATASIPIVAAVLSETLIAQVVGSVARPAGNVTGIVNDNATVIGKHFDLLRELLPDARRVGILIYPQYPEVATVRRVAAAVEATHGLVPTTVDVNLPEDIAPAFRQLAEAVDAIVVGPGNVFSADRARVTALAAEVRLPAIYNQQGYAQAGGLLSYGFDRRANFERAAALAVAILSGTKPSDVPVEHSSAYNLAVNLKTAAELGLTIPALLLARAAVVIE